jgi:hypothetical protein
VVEGLVPAIPVTFIVQTSTKSQRRITAKEFSEYETNNIVSRQQRNDNSCLKIIINSKTNAYKYFFFPRTIIDWNQQSDTTIIALKAKCVPTQLHK